MQYVSKNKNKPSISMQSLSVAHVLVCRIQAVNIGNAVPRQDNMLSLQPQLIFASLVWQPYIHCTSWAEPETASDHSNLWLFSICRLSSACLPLFQFQTKCCEHLLRNAESAFFSWWKFQKMVKLQEIHWNAVNLNLYTMDVPISANLNVWMCSRQPLYCYFI